MLRTTALLCAFVGASSEAVNLTPANFDKEVVQSGKAAFIKFLAPW
jgi:protein disulfide-isomerase A6